MSFQNPNLPLTCYHTLPYNEVADSSAEEVPGELAAFLQFAGAGLEASEADYASDLVRRFQHSIHKIKFDREMRNRYM